MIFIEHRKNTVQDLISVEESVRQLMLKNRISNYLFLDTTMPTLVKNIRVKRGNEFLFRLSSFEPLQNAIAIKEHIANLWVDCFDCVPMPIDIIREAKRNFKLCMVSPELQGGSVADFDRFLHIAPLMDAICTKYPSEWRKVL